MAWCPICKNEYKEGITVCSDCKCELVNSLIDESGDPAVSEKPVMESIDGSEYELEEIAPEDYQEILNQMNEAAPKAFVKSSEKYLDMKSSAYMLLIVGIAGALSLLADFFDLIDFGFQSIGEWMFFGVMGCLFGIFIIVGIMTMRSAQRIQKNIREEENFNAMILDWAKENIQKETIDTSLPTDIAEEEKYFYQSDWIKQVLTQEFGELDASYLEEITEEIYQTIYETE